MFAISVVLTGCSGHLSTSVVPTGSGTINPSTGNFTGDVVLVASPAQYYEFVGWAGAASGSTNPLTLQMNSDKQIVAQFSKIKPTVQVKANPSDGGSVRPDSGQYEAGTKVAFTATPANGYRFDKWGTDASGSANPLSILVNNNITITANFIKQYTLAVSNNPTSGTISTSGGIYDVGTPINLSYTPAFPYAFKNWVAADDNNINPTKVTMNADKSVSVNSVKLTKKTQTPIQKSGSTYGTITIPIDVNQSEWVEGTIDSDTNLPPQFVYIQSPDGQKIKDLGRPGHAAYQFQALMTGKYVIVLQANAISTWGTGYTALYTVYGLQ
jgi:hypothetical protein